ncbi:MAG: Apocarotenoid-15,15'-oxygenase, partial [Myxococcales bacterium]
MPRDGGEPRWLSTDPCFVFHFAAAHDEGERIIVDGFRMDRFPRLRPGDLTSGAALDYPTPVLTRFTLDLAHAAVTARALTEHPGELPGLNPARGLDAH